MFSTRFNKKTILKKKRKKKTFVHNLSTIRVLLLCKTLILKPLCPQKIDGGRFSISIPKISQETFMQLDVISHPHKRRVVRLQVGNGVQVHCTPECSWSANGLLDWSDAWRSCTLGFFSPFVFLFMVSVFLLKFSQLLNVVFMHKVKNFARFGVRYSLSWWRGDGGAAVSNDSSWSPCWQANNRRISAAPLVSYVRHLETAQSLVSLHSRVMWNLL